MTPPRNPTDARIVLASGVLLGVVGLVATALQHPTLVGIDLQVYYFAAEAALAGGELYAVSPPMHPEYGYVYPPVSILFFYPFGLLGSWQAAFAAFTLLNVAAALGVAVLLVRSIEERRPDSLPWLDRSLVAGFCLLSLHSASTLLYGETNFLLLLALVAGFRWLADRRESAAGIAFALPAFVKLFPAAVGVWFLRRRAWRAVATATATGTGLFALSVAAFGVETHLTYVEVAILPRLSSAEFAGGLPAGTAMLTLRRPLSVALPGLDPSLYGPLAFGLLAPAVGYCYRNVSGAMDRLVAVFATMAAIVIGFPSLLLYAVFLVFPLVPLLYLLERGPARNLFVAGAFVANFAVTLANVRSALAGTPFEGLVGVLRPVLTLGTPTLYGTLLMLAGCLVWARNSSEESEAFAESGSGSRSESESEPESSSVRGT